MKNYLFSAVQLEELTTEKDTEKLFQKENVLQKDRDRQIFKKNLRVIGRKDLAVKLVRGKSK